MSTRISRREMLARTSQALFLGTLATPRIFGASNDAPPNGSVGAIIGEEAGAAVGEKVLASGGNAVDAVVAAALTSCVAVPARCGIGGYGGSMIIAMAATKKVTVIDFNTNAPAAARPNMFAVDKKGEVKDRINYHGWLAAGVPGTLAGLQLAIDRYGTRPFRELVKPAIEMAENGFVISPLFARTIKGCAVRFRKDPGSAGIYLLNGEPRAAGTILRNPDLAKMLSTLAERNSVDSFYRGDIAGQIADAFQKNGGLVTSKDLAAYQAREVSPLELRWRNSSIFTGPPTAGGVTILEALAILKSLGWEGLKSPLQSVHAQVEAMRLAWKDRLDLLGDPTVVKVSVDRLLSDGYTRELANKVSAAVKAERPVQVDIRKHLDEGTVNLSCVDRQGNLVAVTLTQGSSFGAQITVDGLGVTLGHGMSRFDPSPDHPNAPGPGKRPLHNMCPSAVLNDGRPVLALGGAGGVRIPDSILTVLIEFVVRGATGEQAIAAPRMTCPGTLDVKVDRGWPESSARYLEKVGYRVRPGESALVSAAFFDPKSRECRAAARGGEQLSR